MSKNDNSPNDRFLIKIFIKIISLDRSQRVPLRSPCPPLIITRVCPWLINHLSDPWNLNKSNGILLRSNWRKPYPKFYGSELFIIEGWSRKLARRYLPTFWGGEGGLLIRCWHYTPTFNITLQASSGLRIGICSWFWRMLRQWVYTTWRTGKSLWTRFICMNVLQCISTTFKTPRNVPRVFKHIQAWPTCLDQLRKQYLPSGELR